uniref:Uncharacterized protein n=1 Tax=Oryza meridionalis TaxID=40149 RepID=A0A0E0ESM5_9ORYZ
MAPESGGEGAGSHFARLGRCWRRRSWSRRKSHEEKQNSVKGYLQSMPAEWELGVVLLSRATR